MNQEFNTCKQALWSSILQDMQRVLLPFPPIPETGGVTTMDQLEMLERLSEEVDRLIGALNEARAENSRLAEELLECRSEADNRTEELVNRQEELNLQNTEIEGLLEKISGALTQDTSEQDQRN